MAKVGLKRIKLSAMAIVFVAALFLTGCGASVTVYDYTENGVRYNTYEIAIDSDVVTAMEASASTDRNGKKYNVRDYLFSLFTEFGYELVNAEESDGTYTVSYRKAVTDEPELFKIGTPVKFTTTSTSNPFTVTYTATSPNPFNGVREYYDNIGADRSVTVLERLKNGVIARDEYGEIIIVSHSVTAAFPYLNGLNSDGLRLNYVQTRSDRMKSTGIEQRAGSRTVRYIFSRYFDYTENTFSYEYIRAVPYGWYLIACAAGVTVLTVILVVTRKKSKLKIDKDIDAE